jgi:hypothetical protein
MIAGVPSPCFDSLFSKQEKMCADAGHRGEEKNGAGQYFSSPRAAGVGTYFFMNTTRTFSPNVAHSVFLPQRGGGGLRSASGAKRRGESPRKRPGTLRRDRETQLPPPALRATSPTLGEERWDTGSPSAPHPGRRASRRGGAQAIRREAGPSRRWIPSLKLHDGVTREPFEPDPRRHPGAFGKEKRRAHHPFLPGTDS